MISSFDESKRQKFTLFTIDRVCSSGDERRYAKKNKLATSDGGKVNPTNDPQLFRGGGLGTGKS